MEVKRYSNDGGTNRAVKEGLCVRHGAKVKRCKIDGCTNNAQRSNGAASMSAQIIKSSKEVCLR